MFDRSTYTGMEHEGGRKETGICRKHPGGAMHPALPSDSEQENGCSINK